MTANSHPTHTLYADIHGAVLKAIRNHVETEVIQSVLSNIQMEVAKAHPYVIATLDAQKAPG